TPDDITIATSGDSLRSAATAFLLSLTGVGVYLFEPRDAVTAPLEPLLLAWCDISINSDFAGAGVLAMHDNHDPMPGSQFRQAATIQAFDGDMKHAHTTSRVAFPAAGAIGMS